MIQFIVPSSDGYHLKANTIYLNVYDVYDSADTFRPLWTITSQFTKKSKTYLPSQVTTDKDRYIAMNTVTTYSEGSEDLSAGIIQLGTTNYPLGFYDVTIYENTSNTNQNPAGLKVVYTGVMNLISENALTGVANPPVTYTEYTTNDADTESVYITI
jgi:Flp pilus assembly protein TadG